MERWDDECVDLIYLDPPFKSDAQYNMLFSNEGRRETQYQTFDNTWEWDKAAAKRYAMYEGAASRHIEQLSDFTRI